MTPLEELQAAHKRLSELREYSGHSDWHMKRSHVSAVKVVNKAYDEIAYVADEVDADLIVTLHRTIDAQLKILGTEIERCTEEQISWRSTLDDPIGHEHRFYWSPTESSLALARAINGEAS